MKTISFRDLQKCSVFSGMNEIEMLSLGNDKKMAWVLEQLGFDVEYAVSYLPNVHRDVQNKVALGFRAVGEINFNRAYINSPMSSITERMIAAAHIDPSLTRELAGLMGMRVNFRALLDCALEDGSESFPVELLEPDYKFVEKQIKDLEDIRDELRGNMFNDRGEAKTFLEYLSH